MRTAIAAACALVAAFGALTLSAGPAEADSVKPLPSVSYTHQILVDDAAGYVFISEGFFADSLQTTGGGILVTDLAGNIVTTLDAGRAAEGIAINGGTLYAALDANDAVAAINVSTIKQPKPKQTLIPLDNSNDMPYDLALQSGKLWVSYDEGGAATGAIGEIDLAAAKPVFTPAALPNLLWYWPPDLAADPSDDGFLVGATTDEDPATLATFNVAGKTPVMLAHTGPPSTFDDCPQDEEGIAMTAGGGTVLAICFGFSGALAFDTATLAPAGQYGAPPNNSLAGAVAVASDGRIAVAASGGDVALSYLRTLTPSGGALNTYESSFSEGVMTNGLAWSADDTKLYAVLVTPQMPLVFSLQIIDNAVSSAVRLTGPSEATYGTPVTVTGNIKAGSIAPPMGSVVTITRTSDHGRTTQFSATTAADGTFTSTDKTHQVPGRYTYTATYGVTTSAPHLIVVRPAQAAVALTLHGFYKTSRHGSVVYHLYHHTATVSAAVQVTPVRPGKCVLLQLQEFYRGKWETKLKTKCAALSSKGGATATIPAKKAVIGHPYRVRADFIPGHDTTIRAAKSDWQYLMIRK